MSNQGTNSRPRLFLILGVVLLVAGLGWYLWFRPGPPALAPEDGQAIATAFLEEIRAGRAGQAWTKTSTDFKSFMGRANFLGFVRSERLLLGPAEFVGCQQKSTSGLAMTECSFRPKTGNKVIKVALTYEQDTWKVAGLVIE